MTSHGGEPAPGREPGADPLEILNERLARGEIDAGEYASRRDLLPGGPTEPGNPAAPRASGWTPGRRRAAATAAAAVLVGAAIGGVLAASSGSGQPLRGAAQVSCTAPANLPGQTVNVVETDHGMGVGPGYGGMMGNGQAGTGQYAGSGRMMRILLSQSTVPAGTISFRVENLGSLTHELVVLPLAPGQQPGTRTVGPDETVSERGSLGEASATCAGGHGDGIRPETSGWVTLNLDPGRYELICNVPGHYAHGMYAELTVR
ncbi:MAG: sulfocyanin-like copper-binding protein [Streptosporangiaceae bacterium]